MRNLALVSLVLAACGAVSSSEAPTDTPDAAAGPPDAGPGALELRILDLSRQPVVGARAVFTSASGGKLLAATSDAEGKIVATIEPHTVVHVAYEEDSSPGFTVHNLVTIVDAAPGDVIALGATTPIPSSAIAGQLSIDPSDVMVPTGASVYTLNLGCTTYETTSLFPTYHDVPAACIGADGQLTVLAEARDADGGLRGRALRRNVPFVDGGSVDLPPWESLGPGVDVVARLPGGSAPRLDLALAAHGVTVEVVHPTGEAEAGERTRYRAPVTRGYAEGYAASLRLDLPADADSNASTLHWSRRGPIGELEAGLDVDLRGRVPRVSQVSYDGAFHWTTAGDPAGAEALFFWLTWGRTDGEGNWYVIAPPDTRAPLSFALHELLDHAPPASTPEWGEMWIHDLADREGDYAFFKRAFGAWELAAERLSFLAEIDLLSIEAHML